MIYYTIALICLSVLALVGTYEESARAGVFIRLCLMLPIYGRVLGWW